MEHLRWPVRFKGSKILFAFFGTDATKPHVVCRYISAVPFCRCHPALLALSIARVAQRYGDIKSILWGTAPLRRARGTEDLGAHAAILLVAVVEERKCTLRTRVCVQECVVREHRRHCKHCCIDLHRLRLLSCTFLQKSYGPQTFESESWQPMEHSTTTIAASEASD